MYIRFLTSVNSKKNVFVADSPGCIIVCPGRAYTTTLRGRASLRAAFLPRVATGYYNAPTFGHTEGRRLQPQPAVNSDASRVVMNTPVSLDDRVEAFGLLPWSMTRAL